MIYKFICIICPVLIIPNFIVWVIRYVERFRRRCSMSCVKTNKTERHAFAASCISLKQQKCVRGSMCIHSFTRQLKGVGGSITTNVERIEFMQRGYTAWLNSNVNPLAGCCAVGPDNVAGGHSLRSHLHVIQESRQTIIFKWHRPLDCKPV